MQHFHSLDEIGRLPDNATAYGNVWATIGTFDGVHLGHQAILTPLAEQAHAAGAAPVAITFYPHPVAVLRGVNEPIYLTSPDERARRMGKLGIDTVITLNFTRELASLTAEEFMGMICDRIGLKQLWVGNDFALGRNRQGDVALLAALGKKMGYSVKVIEAVEGEGRQRISSSQIRRLVREGDVARAAALLGHPYSMEGPVVEGDRRGRQLGFPTANVDYWKEKVVPAYGVYATWTLVNGRRLPSVTSIGVRPTFDPPGAPPRLEAYIIDYDGDLYGKTARIEFLEYLRPELRFSSAEALIDQMALDTHRAREVIAHAG
jgi:riboflavin kinase / FMN adenylyltransferase